MKRLALPLVLPFFSMFGVLTARPKPPPPFSPATACKYNCILPLVDGNRVWLNDTYQPGSIYVLNSAGSYVLDCQSAVNALNGAVHRHQ
jgi:hypothetical protein